MKILITGIHGFVGSNLVRALSPEHTIYGLDIVSPEKEGVEKTYSWDELDKGLLPEVDAIINLAGKAHDTKNQAKADIYFKVNTELTKRIYDYFLTSSAQKFIQFSSVKAAADSVKGDFVDETMEPAPKGPYGESKIAAERYIQEHIAKQTYILRPCMIHGLGNKGNLNLLFGVVCRGIPWPLGAFENQRTFMSIDNLTFIIQGLLTKEIESGIYHVNDDEPVSTNELIEVICQVMDKKVRVWHINRKLMGVFACIGDVLHLPLNSERLRKLTENYISDNRKIKNALGITKMPIRAKEGLRRTILSFKDK
ncbi:MAG: NAD-dependent epimerase/dehydratase family protein [Bacteroidaceae bacterium]|nr:NAD-dependent epimerase/dehydratase family protein [Bacteroidaceae bacterium]